jgi:NitT/TauT family transport system substrate-binding protein
MRKVIGALVGALVLTAASACGGNSGAPPPKSEPGRPDKVSVGVIAIVDVAPIYLGKQKGFFDKRNIDLTLATNQGGATIVPGVVSNQFQFGFSNVTSLILARSRGLPIRMVANGVASTGAQGDDFGGVVVKADSPIHTAADLAGRTVAVNTLQNVGDTTIRASVRKANGDASKIKFTELGFPDMPAALSTGKVDAVWVVEPFLSAVRAQGGRVVAWNFVDAAPDLTIATYFTSQQLLSADPDLVKRFKEAMAESLRYANDHPEEVRAVLSSYTQITSGAAAKLTLPKWPAEINTQSVQTLADLAVKDGILDKAPNMADLVP